MPPKPALHSPTSTSKTVTPLKPWLTGLGPSPFSSGLSLQEPVPHSPRALNSEQAKPACLQGTTRNSLTSLSKDQTVQPPVQSLPCEGAGSSGSKDDFAAPLSGGPRRQGSSPQPSKPSVPAKKSAVPMNSARRASERQEEVYFFCYTINTLVMVCVNSLRYLKAYARCCIARGCQLCSGRRKLAAGSVLGKKPFLGGTRSRQESTRQF